MKLSSLKMYPTSHIYRKILKSQAPEKWQIHISWAPVRALGGRVTKSPSSADPWEMTFNSSREIKAGHVLPVSLSRVPTLVFATRWVVKSEYLLPSTTYL